jgi:hypothetical protein
MLSTRPESSMKIMSSGIIVLCIQKLAGRGGSNTNSIPASSAMLDRNIRPRACSEGSSAISIRTAWAPSAVIRIAVSGSQAGLA